MFGGMSENEKKPEMMDDFADQMAYLADTHPTLADRLESHFAAARDVALEEAALILDAEESDLREPGGDEGAAETVAGLASRIRALKSQPARRFLDAEEVVRVLSGWVEDDINTAMRAVAEALGLDLDATPASATAAAERTIPESKLVEVLNKLIDDADGMHDDDGAAALWRAAEELNLDLDQGGSQS